MAKLNIKNWKMKKSKVLYDRILKTSFAFTGLSRYSRELHSREIRNRKYQKQILVLFSNIFLIICGFPMFSGSQIVKTANIKTTNNKGCLYCSYWHWKKLFEKAYLFCYLQQKFKSPRGHPCMPRNFDPSHPIIRFLLLRPCKNCQKIIEIINTLTLKNLFEFINPAELFK